MCYKCRRLLRVNFAIDVLDGLRFPLLTAPAAWNLGLCWLFELPMVPLWLTITSSALGAGVAGAACLLSWWTRRWLDRERKQTEALIADFVRDFTDELARDLAARRDARSRT